MKSAFASFVLVATIVAALPSDPEAIWSQITPDANLTWTPCYTAPLECARFTVPLDYTKNATGTAAIALVRAPSTLKSGDPDYRGPIILNPGGPGDSGVEFAVQIAAALQHVVGTEYDIVSFDPRGVGRTTPMLHAYMTTQELGTFSVKMLDNPPLNTTTDAFNRAYAQFKSFAPVAETRLQDIGPYVNTPFAARDMLAITRAHGFDKVKYWGISYGTVLGATFATMFPDNIERLILDGVTDAPSYYEGLWKGNMQDTNKTLQYFYDRCVEAGPDECAIHESSASQVETRVEAIFDSLKLNPIAVSNGTQPGEYGIIDYGLMRRVMLDFLYGPFGNAEGTTGKVISQLFYDLEQGENSTSLAAQLLPYIDLSQCLTGEFVQQDRAGWGGLATMTIACSDGSVDNYSQPKIRDWFESLKRDSSYADVFNTMITCAGWKISAAETLRSDQIGGNTSFPMLIIGNTADPVTPLALAKKASTLFNNSVVLTVDTPGHSSWAATSKCNIQAVRSYFRDGVLPKPDTVCGIESRMFGGNDTQADLMARDDDLSIVLRDLAKKVKIPRLGRVF